MTKIVKSITASVAVPTGLRSCINSAPPKLDPEQTSGPQASLARSCMKRPGGTPKARLNIAEKAAWLA